MTNTPLSRFTPSLMPAEVLERLFVGRDDVLDRIMRRVTSAASRAQRNQTLLVGPRGAGKTHLISLTYYRTKRLIDEGARLQISWLPEDPWTIVTYRHLLKAIVEHLEPREENAAAAGSDESELERILVRRAKTYGTIVVLVENLDQILSQIGDLGQQRLRHLLQDQRPLLLVATTTILDRDLMQQDRPFYGYFTTEKLEPLTPDQARLMLREIARERRDTEMVTFLDEDPKAAARVLTVAHVAGGQPRLWALLASALTVSQLDELVEVLLTRFDDLTPYYQEQLARLAHQQRLVVAALADADRPRHVASLAEELAVDERSIAKTMSELSARGWVAPTTSPVVAMLDKRRTYYELAEPMVRLAFQIKAARRVPVRLVIDFLKGWFDSATLSGNQSPGLGHTYAEESLRLRLSDQAGAVARRLAGLEDDSEVNTVPLLAEMDAALEGVSAGDPALYLGLPSAVRGALDSFVTNAGHRAARVEVHSLAVIESTLTSVDVPQWLASAERIVRAGPHESGPLVELTCWQALAGHRADAEVGIETLVRRATLKPSRLAWLYVLRAMHFAGYEWIEDGAHDEAAELARRGRQIATERLTDEEIANYFAGMERLAVEHQSAARGPA